MPDEFGLEVWYVSNPAAPALSGRIDFEGSGVDQTSGIEAVDVVGSTAFTDSDQGAHAVDISGKTLGIWIQTPGIESRRARRASFRGTSLRTTKSG